MIRWKLDVTVFPDSIKPDPDKPEITNYKHRITNKFQTTISKFKIRSETKN
jgi:hypothetical protein